MGLDLKDLMIEVPRFAHYYMEQLSSEARVVLSRSEYDKWKAQSERINKLLEGAEEFDRLVYDKDGYGSEKPGIFIPLPEPDSMEKLVRDIASMDHLDLKQLEFVTRAKALIKKDGEK